MAKNLLVVLCLVCLLIPAHSQTTTFGDTLFSFNAGVMTPSPDRGLVGIEFFDDNFWVTGFNPPTNDHQLYKPFNPSTTISYSLNSAADISLTLFDVLGREVEQLVKGRKSSGQHSFVLNAKALKSGVYFYKLDIGGVAQTRKMLLVR